MFTKKIFFLRSPKLWTRSGISSRSTTFFGLSVLRWPFAKTDFGKRLGRRRSEEKSKIILKFKFSTQKIKKFRFYIQNFKKFWIVDPKKHRKSLKIIKLILSIRYSIFRVWTLEKCFYINLHVVGQTRTENCGVRDCSCGFEHASLDASYGLQKINFQKKKFLNIQGRGWTDRAPMCPYIPTDLSDVYTPTRFVDRILTLYEIITEAFWINFIGCENLKIKK